MNNKIRIGVIGYSQQEFNTVAASVLLRNKILYALKEYGSKNIEIVSGLTYMGVPAIAYNIAKDYGLYTVGIACNKAEEHPCFLVDKKILVGEEWGDESQTFIDYINVLFKLGGGKQSEKERAMFVAQKGEHKVHDIELPPMVNEHD